MPEGKVVVRLDCERSGDYIAVSESGAAELKEALQRLVPTRWEDVFESMMAKIVFLVRAEGLRSLDVVLTPSGWKCLVGENDAYLKACDQLDDMQKKAQEKREEDARGKDVQMELFGKEV